MIEMDFDHHWMAEMNQGHFSRLTVIEINFSHLEASLVFKMMTKVGSIPIDFGQMVAGNQTSFGHHPILTCHSFDIMAIEWWPNCFGHHVIATNHLRLSLKSMFFGWPMENETNLNPHMHCFKRVGPL